MRSLIRLPHLTRTSASTPSITSDSRTLGLIRLLALPREANRPPLLSATFNLDPEVKGLEFAGLTCSVAKNPKHFVNFDLHWNLVEQGDEYLVECEYATDLFDEPTIERLARSVSHVAFRGNRRSVAVGRSLAAHDRFRAQSRARGMECDGDAYPADRCVHQLFEEHARRSPESVALASNGSVHQLRRPESERESARADCGPPGSSAIRSWQFAANVRSM